MKYINLPEKTPPGVVHKTFYSKLLNHDVGYNIFLPSDYEKSNKKYPVMYWMHGSGGNESSDIWVAEHIQKHYDANPQLAQMIVVFINGFETSGYMNSYDGSLPIESVIINELVPHIDSTYRTAVTRTNRVIEGFSMGGYGAFLYAVKYPEVFCSAVSYSGAFYGGKLRTETGEYLKWDEVSKYFPEWVEEIYKKDPAFVEKASAYYWSSENADMIRRDVKIRLICGDLDFLFDKNENMHSHLNETAIPHEYEILSGVDHNIGMMYEICGEKGLVFHNKNILPKSED